MDVTYTQIGTISDTLLKKGTKQHSDGWDTSSQDVVWIGAFYQERQQLCLPKDDLRDSSSWSSPPLVLLRDLHTKLISQYDCKEVSAPYRHRVM